MPAAKTAKPRPKAKDIGMYTHPVGATTAALRTIKKKTGGK